MTRKHFAVALVVAMCLAVPCGQVLASENETEMTGGFTPVELGTGASSSGSVGSESKSGQEETSGIAGGVPSGGAKGWKGIRLEDGSVITVDSDGRLTHMAPSGDTHVLDVGRKYAVEAGEDGSAIIRDGAGNPVTVEGTTVSFTGADGNRVRVETSSGANETELSNEGQAVEEAQGARTNADAATSSGTVPIIACVVAAIGVATAIFFRHRGQEG